MTYVPPDIEVDRDAIVQGMIDDAATEGVVVVENTALWRILRVVASRHADELERLYARAENEYDDYGRNMLRQPRRNAVSSTATVTITAIDTAGYALAAGTGLSFAATDGGRVAFQLAENAVIPNGDTDAQVDVVAVVGGTDGDDLGDDPQLDVAESWVDTITTDTFSSGGQNEETQTEYVNRLSELLELLGITLTTARKFAIAARTVAGVGSALAIDLYKADTDDDDAEGHITVAVRAADGTPVAGGVRATVEAFLEANALSVVEIWVIDPTYTTIAVAFTGKVLTGYDPATVQASAEAAVEAFLSPARWGLPPTGDRPDWVDVTKVRFQDVSAVLNNVEGFDYWTALTLNAGSADITLTGPAGLPGVASTATGSMS